MKKYLVLFLAMVSVASAQNPFVEYSGSQITWTNESGTRVYAIANGDTLTTQAFDIALYDEALFSFCPTSGDTVHFNVRYQLGGGVLPSTNGGFYTPGWKAVLTPVDSAAAVGSRLAAPTFIPIQLTTLMHTYDYKSQVTSDSTKFNYGQVNVNQKVGAQYVRFVIIGYVGQDVTNTTILNQCRVVLRRKQQ